MPDKQTVAAEILNPWTGELVSTTDSNIDELWELYETATAESRKCYAVTHEVRLAFEQFCPRPEDTMTARVRSQNHRYRVTYPSEKFDSSILADALSAYPHLGCRYLRITKVEPVRKEVKKLKHEQMPGDPAFEQFKKMVLGANLGPTGLPRLEKER